MNKLFVSIALAACAAATVAYGAAAPAGDPVKGKANFARVGCWECHGYQGQGGANGPRISAPVPLAFPALSAFVRSTDGEMPPFTTKLVSDAELIDIYAYLSSIPKGPDPKTIPILSQ